MVKAFQIGQGPQDDEPVKVAQPKQVVQPVVTESVPPVQRRKPYSEMTCMELAILCKERREAGLPEDPEQDKWFNIKHREEYGPTKIYFKSDPRELFPEADVTDPRWNYHPEEIPWQEKEPWRTIKTHLPPAMIDTPEKEEKTAWRIGFLLGYGAEKATVAAIKEFGMVGGAATIALFAWAYQYTQRNK